MTLPDLADLWVELDGAVRYGVRAQALVEHAPNLVRLLVPDDTTPLVIRAIAAEGLLRLAVTGLGGAQGAAVAALVGLADGMGGQPLGVRREHAAAALGLTGWALQKPARRDGLLLGLAVEVCRVLHTVRNDQRRP
ncbi:hypothetical protein [Parafrankia sp. BMG5.11]|uniref:hypothetical protein n=1 Tax=Parafrankia sp. BMG5.11 TaxID=222540 RepID=UPI00103D96C0|nr:hypothetical protein [Parafrankia sp. BMG5.11]TCJ32425.1 hypothetical protein E0504_42860 [Parafrankia sp. BMG5.11]